MVTNTTYHKESMLMAMELHNYYIATFHIRINKIFGGEAL